MRSRLSVFYTKRSGAAIYTKERNHTLLIVLAMCWAWLLAVHAEAQPFVDPFQVRYLYAFKNKADKPTPLTHLWAGSDIPLKLKEKTYLLLSPYYEQWNIQQGNSPELSPTVHSVAFPVGLILPIRESRWSVTAIPILRSNGERLLASHTFQYGGVTFLSYARKPHQKFRLGVYTNTEFFGLFIMPLAGVDWQINEKNYLFGLLPGRITYEHKWHKKIYGGATFRAITNSYRLSDGRFMRLDDNQLSLYLDYYLTNHLCVTLEPGYGVFRKIRTGRQQADYTTQVAWGDGLFIKLSTSCRIRL